jgi:hypothetical protein
MWSATIIDFPDLWAFSSGKLDAILAPAIVRTFGLVRLQGQGLWFCVELSPVALNFV